MRRTRSQGGFTLIELLTVIGIIGLLAALGLQSFSLYRANAAFAAVQRSLADAHTDADATLSNTDASPASVAFFNQRVPGPISNASARALLPVTQVARNISFTVSYDAGCSVAGCMSAFLEARHLNGRQFVQWMRTGDGYWTSVEMAGSGW